MIDGDGLRCPGETSSVGGGMIRWSSSWRNWRSWSMVDTPYSMHYYSYFSQRLRTNCSPVDEWNRPPTTELTSVGATVAQPSSG